MSVPANISFQGLEIIPNLTSVLDTDGQIVFEKVVGSSPIVICAAHSGSGENPGVIKYGVNKNFSSTRDAYTLEIAYGILRTLSSLGCKPYGIISHVSRKYIDLNRRLRSHVWQKAGVESTIDTVDPDFKRIYYEDFHNTLSSFVTDIYPDGWLFDIHGSGVDEHFGVPNVNIGIGTTMGWTARRDFVYDNHNHSLHSSLQEVGFVPYPVSLNPYDEIKLEPGVVDFGTSLISCRLYGAGGRLTLEDKRDLPLDYPIVPIERGRAHAVQLEIDNSLRFDRSKEQLESVGINLAYAIYNCLKGNGLL